MFCFTVDGLHTNHFLSHAISTKFLRIQENMLKTIISYLELDLNIAWEPRRLMNMTHGSNAMSIEKKLGGGGGIRFTLSNLFAIICFLDRNFRSFCYLRRWETFMKICWHPRQKHKKCIVFTKMANYERPEN